VTGGLNGGRRCSRAHSLDGGGGCAAHTAHSRAAHLNLDGPSPGELGWWLTPDTDAAAVFLRHAHTQEDEALCQAVAVYGLKRWSQISSMLPGRTSKACSHR
jgi:hypothetical protein